MSIIALDDLENKTVKKNIVSIDELERQINEPSPSKPTLYSELGAPFVHAASLAASDIPKAIGSRDTSEAGKEAYQTLYPEQQTVGGKILRGAASVPAFAFGTAGKATMAAGRILKKGAEYGAKKIPQFVGKSLLGRTALRTGEFAAGQAAIAPKEGENYGEQVKTAALTGAAVPAAGLLAKGTGKNLIGAGKFTAKTFGGITDFSREKIKELGSARVFDPLKKSVSYIGDVVVPKVKQRITGIITEAKNYPALRNLGLIDDEINGLREVNPEYKSRLEKILSGDEVNIKPGIEAITTDAKNRFAAVMSKVNPNTAIEVKDFYYKLKSTLRSQGWLGKTGEPVEKVGRNQVRDQLLSVYSYLNKTIKQPGGYRTNVIDVREYENLRSALDMVTGTKDDRLLFELGGKIRDEAAKVIKGLPEINKMYADAMRLGEIEKRGILSKIMSKERLEKELSNLRNIDRPNQVARIKSLIGKDLADDVDAHLVNIDLGLTTGRPGSGGGVFPGPSGVKKALLAEGAKTYYKDIYPITQKIKGGYESLRTGAENVYKSPLSGGRIFKSAPNLKGERGSLGVSPATPLIEEAKKYKTAGEWIKSKPYLRSKIRREMYKAWKEKQGIKDISSDIERGDSIHPPASPESGSPLYDLTQNGTYPEDIYSSNGLRYYGSGEDVMDATAYSIISAAEGNPRHQITVYRAVEKYGKPIQPGDWVTTVKQYAKEHGESTLKGDYKIVSKTVSARDLFTEGNSMLEYGYHPQKFIPGFKPLTSLWQQAQGNIEKGSLESRIIKREIKKK